MVSITWCLSQKNGLEIITPNTNMSNSYINMAQESVKTLPNVINSSIWTATMSYYIFYYSLYSLMLRIGIKSEIHSCSLEFMKIYLMHFFTKTDIKNITSAFSARIDLQYYSDGAVDKKTILTAKKNCIDFYIKTKDILSSISEKQIAELRTSIMNHQD